MRAARAGGGEALEDDAAALGIPAETVEAWAGRDEAEAFAVWPENRDAVELFVGVQTQWKCQVVAGAQRAAIAWTGLDYAGVAAAAGAMGVDLTPALFGDLRAMEAAALPALNGAEG